MNILRGFASSKSLCLAGWGTLMAAGLVLYWSAPVMLQYGYPLVLDIFPWLIHLTLTPPPLRLPEYLASHRFYYFTLAVLSIAYGGAVLGLVRRPPPDSDPGRVEARGLITLILLGAFSFQAILFFLPGFLSQDIFVYVSTGRMQVIHGANPYLHPPLDFPQDSSLPHVGVPEYRAVYGPLWVGITRLVVAISGTSLAANLLALKLFLILANLACLALILAISSRAAPAARVTGLLLYAWNPLVLLEVAGNGHNDVMVLLFLLAGGLFFSRGARLAGWGCVVAAALIKLTGVIFWPIYLVAALRRSKGILDGAKDLLLMALVAGGLFMAGFGPYWVGWATLSPTLSMSELYTNSLVMSLNHWLQIIVTGSLHWPADLVGLRVHQALSLVLKLAFLIYLALKIRYIRGPQDLWEGWRDTGLFFVLFVMQYYWPWYLVPLLGVAAAGAWRPRAWPVYVFSLASLFIYGMVWSRKLLISGNFWHIAIIYGVAILVWWAGVRAEAQKLPDQVEGPP